MYVITYSRILAEYFRSEVVLLLLLKQNIGVALFLCVIRALGTGFMI